MWPFYIVCGLLALLYWKYFQQSKYNLPPGPLNLPFIGAILQIMFLDARRPVVAFQKLAAKYGNIFYLRVGYVPMVVINGHKLTTKISNLEEFSEMVDGIDVWSLEKSEGLTLGLFFGKKKFWTDTRNFTLKLLKKYGFGRKNILERLILDQLKEFVVDLRMDMAQTGGVIYIDNQFSAMFLNNVWLLITGEPFGNKNQIQKMLKIGNDFLKSGKFGGGIAALFPGLIKYFPRFTGYTELCQTCASFRNILMEEIAKRRISAAFETSPECFLDEFLHEIDKADDFGNVYSTIYSVKNLVAVLQDLVLGGNDTISHMMKFFIRYMLQYPEVQKNLHTELDSVLGDTCMSVEDIPRLIYTQAVMYELLRICNIIPAVPRKAINDIKCEGYDIPKGTMILCNLWSVNLDESIWENPNEFQPERFIDKNGDLVNIEKLYSFGFGKRMCIGNALAKTNLMLTICVLMQEFRFEVDAAEGLPSDTDIHGFTRDTTPYHVLIKNRHGENRS